MTATTRMAGWHRICHTPQVHSVGVAKNIREDVLRGKMPASRRTLIFLPRYAGRDGMDPMIMTSAILRARGMDPREVGRFAGMYPDGASLSAGNILRMLRAGIRIRSLVQLLGGDLTLYDRVVESARMVAEEAEAEVAVEAIHPGRKPTTKSARPGMEEVWEQLREDTYVGAEPAVIRLTEEEFRVVRQRIADLEGALRRLLACHQIDGYDGESRPGGERSISEGILEEARNLLEGTCRTIP